MKFWYFFLGLLLLGCPSLWLQAQEGPRPVTAAQAVQANNYTLQVGVPYLGDTTPQDGARNNETDLRFPWDVLYLNNTFGLLPDQFSVSKGFFGNKIELNWQVLNNADLITSFRLERREVSADPNTPNDFQFVANISASTSSYEDNLVEGGVLYEYKLIANGISDSEDFLTTFVTGIGYRNPTAIVTGNITFEGGQAVQGVSVIAEPVGASSSFGSTLVFNSGTSIPFTIDDDNDYLTDNLTIQLWAKANEETSEINPLRLFQLDGQFVEVYQAANNQLVVKIGNQEFQINEFYPIGEVDNRGDEILNPISNWANEFVHYTLVLSNSNQPLLYINGRPITVEYAEQVRAARVELDPTDEGPFFTVTEPTGSFALSAAVESVVFGAAAACTLDEIRIWNRALLEDNIATDYKRYIVGNDADLKGYFRADETVGDFAYDLSKDGFNFNQNHIQLPANVSFSTAVEDKPTTSQFGVLGVSDASGNYEIASIPYTGDGESFTITPRFGQHSFDPNQQLIFLGSNATVANNVDFTDVSSFTLNGRVHYDSRGVFASIVQNQQTGSTILYNADDIVNGGDGYNQFQVLDNGNVITLYEGQYWRNADGDVEEYARIAVEGANIYIDGSLVLDENNIPVLTDENGNFSIQVPIGNHYIEVRKPNHNFKFNGRFPKVGFSEFFEDRAQAVQFLNETKVAVVGKVVGGSVEAAKPIGFGFNGLRTVQVTDSLDIVSDLQVSAKNNIGQAQIKFGYQPPSGIVQPETTFTINTNTESGEYRANILPLQYTINSQNGISILNDNPANPDSDDFLSADLAVNYQEVVDSTLMQTPEFVYETYVNDAVVSDTIVELPYNYKQNFIYRSNPEITVLEQTSDANIEIEGDNEGDEPVVFSTDNLQVNGTPVKIYTQGLKYYIDLKSFERYTNFDNPESVVEDLVPITDGELVINNNFELSETRSIEINEEDASIRRYNFRAGIPNTSAPFTKSISLSLRINTNDYNVEGDLFVPEGIVLGGASDGSQTFVTAGPDIPDIILRDPPGTNSFASIESGQTLTSNKSLSIGTSLSSTINAKVSAGVKFEIGGSITGPAIETEIKEELESGIEKSISGDIGSEITNTYTFNQTISTSADPDFVGSSGDLYIGQSKNYFYGTFNQIRAVTNPEGFEQSVVITNNQNENLHIALGRAISMVEEPADTFFVFSQNQILQTVIPELEVIIANIDNGSLNPDDPGSNIQPREFYIQQINLWRKVILENERAKYRATYERNELLAEVIANNTTSIFGIPINFLELAFINDNFEDNISFDAGVGSIERSFSTGVTQTTNISFSIAINQTFASQIGVEIGGSGFEVSQSITAGINFNTGASLGEENITTFAYTLQDNDLGNFLSVDVVNAFDGNGPIFSTQGGRTSCPYEGAELSNFYNHDLYTAQPNAIEIPELNDEQREALSFATLPNEVPEISVNGANDVVGIRESDAAEFRLLLRNNTVGETGADSDFLLVVDNTTNPDGAIFNLEPNGTIVNVPEGATTEFLLTMRKGAEDVFDYNDIVIRLESLCDEEDVSDEITISAEFVKVCTPVVLDLPLDNWVFNKNEAANLPNGLPIQFGGFNTEGSSFQRIALQYRLASSPTWTLLQEYYKDQDAIDALDNFNGELPLDQVTNNNGNVQFNWNILEDNLQDGDYEIRAISYCTDNTEFVSNIALGKIDITAPVKFGTPQPTDGILSAGEDMSVSFNEDIFLNSAISKIQVRGATNQLPVRNDVSLRFSNPNNNTVITNPNIPESDLSVEFWMLDEQPNTNATIIQQEGGLEIGYNATGELYFTLGGQTITSTGYTPDNLFDHFTFTYEASSGTMSMYQNTASGNQVLASQSFGEGNITIANNNTITIGGSAFVGNLHALRLWTRFITSANAAANKDVQIFGNEQGLYGYWSMEEGRGNRADDLVRFNHAIVNTDWDIKPKGTSFAFDGNQHLSITNDQTGINLTNEMDATISVWVKASPGNGGTIFSNGRGNGDDLDQTLGDNKWALSMSSSGNLNFFSEGNTYSLTPGLSLNDDNWHHISILINRQGVLQTYIDANLVSSLPLEGLGGFSNASLWLGARAFVSGAGNPVEFDDYFIGEIDEFRLWNTLRTIDQEERDQFQEIEPNALGLFVYAKLNERFNTSGQAIAPLVFLKNGSDELITTNGEVAGMDNFTYSDNTPALKPERAIIDFVTNTVINGNQMIITLQGVTEAQIEGQILDITIDRMFDAAGNRQESPITWTAFMQRNQVNWFVEGYPDDVIDFQKQYGDNQDFTITIVNSGGLEQPYNITNSPSWLSLSSSSGNIPPNGTVLIQASINPELSIGNYVENIYLSTDFGFDQRLNLNVRVLGEEPDWSIDPSQFDYSMNIVGRISVDGVISEDLLDNVGAFVNDEVRGSADVIFDEVIQSYLVFLTVYSNQVSESDLRFKIWDASQGQILNATLDSEVSIDFLSNQVIGTLSSPSVFANSGESNQTLNFNQGWTWVSFNVNDDRFSNINDLTNTMVLETGNRILAHSPAQVEIYEQNVSNPLLSGWAGTVSANGGLDSQRMFRVNLSTAQQLVLEGAPVDLLNFSFNVVQGWNWLPYPIPRSVTIQEVMANYNATDGDLLKSQNEFAIYDSIIGWVGNLTSMENGQGYMLLSGQEQLFQYPAFLNSTQGRYVNPSNVVNNNLLSHDGQNISDFSEYPSNMNMIIKVPDNFSTVYAYDSSGKLRGKANREDTETTDLIFLTLHGSVEETLSFMIGSDTNLLETEASVIYNSDSLIGTLEYPFVIALTDNLIYTSPEVMDHIYPNPFTDELKINVSSKHNQSITVDFYDMYNKLVVSNKVNLNKGINSISLTPNITPGVYIVQMKVDGKVMQQKVIKL